MRVAESSYHSLKIGRHVRLQRNGERWTPAAEHLNWGYQGRAVTRLAWHLLYDASSGDQGYARDHHDVFAKKCLTALPREWDLTAAQVIELVGGMYRVHTSAQPTK